MKTLCLFRDSYDAKYILSQLDKRELVNQVIIETGQKARSKKLRNLFRNSNIFLFPKIILDVIALVLYSEISINMMIKKLGKYNYPENKIKLYIEDANDQTCISFVNKYKPDVVFIYGTAILRKDFFKGVKALVINIHSGIVPMYRNVHSDFWAYINNDNKNIGISLIRLDEGIDSGDVVFQKKISIRKQDNLVDIKIKNLQLIPKLIEELLESQKNKKLAYFRQDRDKVGFYKTPGLLDLIRLTYRSKQ